jgi:hypothetical protein
MKDQSPIIAQVFAAQKDGVVARRTSFDYAARKAALDALEGRILAEKDAICVALAADFGKHADEVVTSEILPILVEITQAGRFWPRVLGDLCKSAPDAKRHGFGYRPLELSF